MLTPVADRAATAGDNIIAQFRMDIVGLLPAADHFSKKRLIEP